MNSKKKIYAFILVSFLLILALPTLNFINKPKYFSYKDMFNTDILESYRNFLGYKVLSKSFDNHTVIVGKDDFLFLGNENNYLVSMTQNLYPKHPKSIKNWVNNLHSLQQWYESQGIKFVIAVVPNKHTVYSEYLPNWIETGDDLIVEELILKSKQIGTNIKYLKDDLISNKSQSEWLYNLTDSHWNSKGASIGFHKIMDFINNKYQLGLKSPIYKMIEKNRGGMGLARLLKMEKLIDAEFETVYYPRPNNLSSYCQGDIDGLKLKDCEKDGNLYFDIHKGPKYTINPKAVNKQKLLLLCDSFSMQNSKLYDSSFKTIWKFHFNKITQKELSSFIQVNKPDLVIYQVVERSLYNNKFNSKY